MALLGQACQEVSLDGTLRPGGEDSECHFDRMKRWPKGRSVRKAGFSSELGCPVTGVSSSIVRAFPHCWALAPGARVGWGDSENQLGILKGTERPGSCLDSEGGEVHCEEERGDGEEGVEGREGAWKGTHRVRLMGCGEGDQARDSEFTPPPEGPRPAQHYLLCR